MTHTKLRRLLEDLARGRVAVDDAMRALEHLPFRELEAATVDHHRALRMGCPEVIFGAGKTAEQIEAIARELADAGQNVLITRLDPECAAKLGKNLPELRYLALGRVAVLEQSPPPPRPCGPVAVVTAGTSDLPVAEEATATLSALGLRAACIHDVGVAGIHRLLHRVDDLSQASAAIVIAGMEGALPSVVGGIVSCPLVAVPTSTGYGTALGGFTALMAMLTSCASGITVVNIDNGFGAAMAVHRMLPRAD
ncbi:MAG: nickel pincer cofactor biosynthesis protein LarB [Deltaproteobacteria bacterium]|jgi:NCAIR mutase (PurE)-related protein|nr:nickel pincer cofactor biosynthesis protein LarB [Deltaproteobacteria bacterium]MBW2535094.1 nickel pincer cofactor biosynthesis protein LarB [Deltaproteobacteria bacterium]